MTELRLPKPPKELIKLEIAYLRECYAVANQTRDNGKPLYNAKQLCKYATKLVPLKFGLRRKLSRSVIEPCKFEHKHDTVKYHKKQIGATK